jgi:hypothetical protein
MGVANAIRRGFTDRKIARRVAGDPLTVSGDHSFVDRVRDQEFLMLIRSTMGIADGEFDRGL